MNESYDRSLSAGHTKTRLAQPIAPACFNWLGLRAFCYSATPHTQAC